MSDEVKQLRQRAGEMLDWPLADAVEEESGTTIKPARWGMADAAKLLQTAFDLERAEVEPEESPAFGLALVEVGERRRPEHLAELGVSGYQELYHRLIEQGWRWQKAAFMAWRASPRRHRQPATQAELAEILGYASDAIFRRWLNKPEQGPLMKQVINQARRTVFEINLADVDHVTIERAASFEGSTADRKLYYDIRERLADEAGGGETGDDFSDYSDEELQAEIERLEQIAA